MKLGLFMMPVHPPEKPLVQTYQEDRELLVLADELGFSEAWIGEHATMAWENIPAPDLLIAQALARTSQMRLATGVSCLPNHDPMMLAQRIAQLPEMPKKVLALYYYENLRLADIAACFGLTESRIC